MAVADGFEQVSANGVQCVICGATVQPITELTDRHRDWHRQIEEKIAEAATTPSIEYIDEALGSRM